MSTSKMRVGLLIGAGIGLLAIVGLGVAVLLLSGEEETTPKPTRRPDTGFFVTQGPFITVQTTTPTDTVLGTGQIINIRAEDVVGIRSIQIRHRNELVGEPDFRAGQHTVYVSYPWIPETAGEHEFRVTAITSDGRSGDRTFILESDCCPPPTDVLLNYEVEPGENLPTIAAKFGLCLEELTSANPTIREVSAGDVLRIPFNLTTEGDGATIDPEDCQTVPIASDIPRQDRVYPVDGGRISRGFGCAEFFTGYRGTDCPEDQPWFHTGLDISLEEGQPVTNVDGGRVTYAGPDVTSNADCSQLNGSVAPHNGYGRHVRIVNGSFLFLYAHLSGIAVPEGQQFDGSGYVVGLGGSTGCSTGSHLHLEIRNNGSAIDPLTYIGNLEAQSGGAQ